MPPPAPPELRRWAVMMNRSFAIIILILVASVVTPQDSNRKTKSRPETPRLENPPAREIKSKVRSSNAPAESIAVLRHFLTYVFKPEPNLMKDCAAQAKLLSRHTRDGIDHLWKAYAKFEKDNPGYDCSPDNDLFVGAWDYPTTYSIIGSRRYASRVLIDVQYRWGPDTQYPGDQRLVSYVLVFEDNTWKLGDIYTLSGEYTDAHSLTTALWVDVYRC